MKVISSSPYAPFNSKEWNSLISKNAKFENTPIKIQKKFYRTFTLKKGINKLRMILLFIYQTYNSYKLDKKNQSILKDNLKSRKVDAVVAL